MFLRSLICLAALLLLALLVTAAPACDVPVQAQFAPQFAPGYAVQQAPVFFQPASVMYAPQRAFAPAPVYVPRSRGIPGYGGGGGFAPIPVGGGVNVNVNSGNVGRQRSFGRR